MAIQFQYHPLLPVLCRRDDEEEEEEKMQHTHEFCRMASQLLKLPINVNATRKQNKTWVFNKDGNQ